MKTIHTLGHYSWNDLMEKITRSIPYSFSFDPNTRWKHPWSISSNWDYETKQWLFSIEPGFVNGIDIGVDTKVKFCSGRTIERLEDLKIKTSDPDLSVEAFLTEYPKIEVGSGTRIIGNGSDPESISFNDNFDVVAISETVPKFFLDLGVEASTTVIGGNASSGITFTETPGEEGARRLRALDVVMFKDRPSAKFEVVRGDILDGYIGRIDINYNHSGDMKDYPYIKSMPKYVDLIEPAKAGVSLEGIVDPEWDITRMCTIYFLSPKGYSVSAPLDETWTTYVKYNHFWNLAHSPQSFPDLAPINPIILPSAMLGGIATILFAQLLAPLNDKISSVLAQLKARSMKGAFWSL